MPALPAGSTVTCPQCGGATALPSGRHFVRCTYCDATLHVDRGGVVNHYRVPRRLSADEARRSLNRWMAGNDTVKDLDTKATVESLTPVAFPMWMFRTRGAGGEETYVEPAAPTPIPQLADLSLPAGELEPYAGGEDGAETVEAAVPLETARGWLEQRGVGEIHETALVEVPLWHCRYRFDGRSYQAVVDASTGEVLAAVYPEKAESPYVLVAVLGLVLFTLEGLLISNLFVKAVAFLLTAVPLALLAFLVTRKV